MDGAEPQSQASNQRTEKCSAHSRAHLKKCKRDWRRSQELRTKYQEPGIKNWEPRTRNQEPRTANQETRTSNKEPRTSNQEPRTKNQRPGTVNQQPGTRNQNPGIRNQETGTGMAGNGNKGRCPAAGNPHARARAQRSVYGQSLLTFFGQSFKLLYFYCWAFCVCVCVLGKGVGTLSDRLMPPGPISLIYTSHTSTSSCSPGRRKTRLVGQNLQNWQFLWARGSHLWRETLGPWCRRFRRAAAGSTHRRTGQRSDGGFNVSFLCFPARGLALPLIPRAGGGAADGTTVANTFAQPLGKKKKNPCCTNWDLVLCFFFLSLFFFWLNGSW